MESVGKVWGVCGKSVKSGGECGESVGIVRGEFEESERYCGESVGKFW